MFKIDLMIFVCLGILGSYFDIQAMKKSLSQEFEQAKTILSFPAEIHAEIVASSRDKNALNLTCKAFHRWASYANWKQLLNMFHTTLYLSRQDLERIGFILRYEDNFPLMKKLLEKYPEYGACNEKFVILSFNSCDPTSKVMRELIMKNTIIKDFDNWLKEKDGISFSFFTMFTVNNFLRAQAELGNLKKENHAQDFKKIVKFFHAIIKGDFDHVEKLLELDDLKKLCDDLSCMNHALALAATYGYYNIAELIIKQPLFQKAEDYSGHISEQTFIASLGQIVPMSFIQQEPPIVFKDIRSHEKIAELIITSKKICCDKCHEDVEKTGSSTLISIYKKFVENFRIHDQKYSS